MAEFVGIGDLHMPDSQGLGGLAKYIENPERMICEEIRKVLEYARARQIRHVIQYGDVCDGARMSYDSMCALDDLFREHQDLVFWIILGNHDMLGTVPEAGHSLQVLQRMVRDLKNVRIMVNPVTKKIDGAPVRFLPYPHTPDKRGALNVFHNEVYGSKSDSGRVYKDDQLSKSKCVSVGGHLHTAHQVRNTHFSGTLYQNNFGESLPKYFHHIQYNSDEDFDISLVPHDPTYKLYTCVIENRRDLREIPVGEHDLIKLVLKDGASVSAEDYAHLKNIVILRNFGTKDELVSVLSEDLAEGAELTIDVDEFFSTWVESLDVDQSMRDRVVAVRSRIINKLQTGKSK